MNVCPDITNGLHWDAVVLYCLHGSGISVLCTRGSINPTAVKRHMMMMGVMTTTVQECQKDDYYQRGELYCIVSTSHHKTPVTSLAGIPCVPCLALTALLCSALSLLILHVLYDPKKQQRHVRDLQPTAGKYIHKAHPHFSACRSFVGQIITFPAKFY